jgi:predicted amino acid-binding ACT domain protein
MVFLWRVCVVLVAGAVVSGQVGLTQTAKPKPKTSVKPGMAAWSPEVQKTLGVTAENFNAEGLNKLTQAQLTALLISARPDPRKGLLMCPASGTVPAGRIKVLVTVTGDDSTGAIAAAIKEAVAALNEVDVVDSAATADRALHVVILEQTVNKRTIGFTASYLTATPCTEEIGGKKTDVELKGTLGTYSNAKGPGLAKDLAGMMDQDIQTLRR